MGDHDDHYHRYQQQHRPHHHYNNDDHPAPLPHQHNHFNGEEEEQQRRRPGHGHPREMEGKEEDYQQPHYMRGGIQAHHMLFCSNGDFFTPPRRVIINPRYHRDLPHLLDDLTLKLQPPFGAIRKICTPEMGRRVRSVEDLQPGKLYVVADCRRLKQFGYEEINRNRKRSPPRNLVPGEPNRRFQNVPMKYMGGDTQGTIIKCWANGKGKEGNRLVLLPSGAKKPDNVRDVIIIVSECLGRHCGGAVYKLFETNGCRVRSMDQIRPHGCYVALKRKEAFINDDYQEGPQPGMSFSQPSRLRKHPTLPPISNSNSTKTSSHSSPDHSTTSNNGYRREREKPRRHQDDQVFTRPTRYKRSSERGRQADFDQDNGGVFKAKNQNRATRGAREVEDSRSTRTELPLDQREAEIVQDEDLDLVSPRNDRREERRSRESRERRRRKEEPASREKERAYRTNARRADSPSNEQARREREEKEREARARREAEDRARKEKQQQQQEAMRRRKKEKDEQDRRKREEEEERRKAERERQRQEKEEEREKRRKEQEEKEEERERRRKEKERRREEEEEERERQKKRAAASRRTPTPDRFEDTKDDRSARNSPAPVSDRPGTETLQENHRHGEEAQQEEEWAATRIQAGFRGYRDRRDLQEKRAKQQEEKEREAEMAKRAEQQEEEWAATRIQAGFRGYRDRQELKQRRAARDGRDSPARSDAGPPSPAGGEDEDLDEREQERAATKIQAGFRGARARREVKAMREEKEIW